MKRGHRILDSVNRNLLSLPHPVLVSDTSHIAAKEAVKLLTLFYRLLLRHCIVLVNVAVEIISTDHYLEQILIVLT